MNNTTRIRRMYRGLMDGKEVVGWNTNRERVYSRLRRMMPRDRSKGNGHRFSIEGGAFIEKKGDAA